MAHESLDLVVRYTFWREGCHTFAKNVWMVLELAKKGESLDDLFRFINSLPLTRLQLSSPEWIQGFCQTCLQAAYQNTPDDKKDTIARPLMHYFLEFFPERHYTAQAMLIDAFVGIMFGSDEAFEELKKGG